MKKIGLLFLALSSQVYGLQSEVQWLTAYDSLQFQNTTLQMLQAKYGPAKLYSPPGEVIQSDEVCYSGDGDFEITFYIDRHNYRSKKGVMELVVGVYMAVGDRSMDSDDPFRRTTPCDTPIREMPRCIGKLCIGDDFFRASWFLQGIDYWTYNEWQPKVKLESDDLILKYYDEKPGAHWMAPSHDIRVYIDANKKIKAIYSSVQVDTSG